MAVPPVLSDLVSAPNAPNRSGQGRRTAASKIYENPDKLPTLGRGLTRDITLYHRDGELLDTYTSANLVESIHMTPTVDGHTLAPIVVGERRASATVTERLQDLERVPSLPMSRETVMTPQLLSLEGR